MQVQLKIIHQGHTHLVKHSGFDSVLKIALAAGLDIPYGCQAGVCFSCRAKLIDGQVDMDSGVALTPAEIEQGYVLACQSVCLTEQVTLSFDAT